MDKGDEDGGGKWPPVTHALGIPSAAPLVPPATCRPAHMRNNQSISTEKATKGQVRTMMMASLDHPPRRHLAITTAAAAVHAVRMVVGSPASPAPVSRASGMGIQKGQGAYRRFMRYSTCTGTVDVPLAS